MIPRGIGRSSLSLPDPGLDTIFAPRVVALWALRKEFPAVWRASQDRVRRTFTTEPSGRAYDPLSPCWLHVRDEFLLELC